MNQEIQIYVILSSSIRLNETSTAEAYTSREEAEARKQELAEAFSGWNLFAIEAIPLNPNRDMA